MRVFLFLFLLAITSLSASAQGFFNTHIITYLKGPGTYQLQDGTTGEGKLSFSTRNASVLFAGKGRKFTAEQVQSFTIDNHTLVPAGNFDFQFGVNSFRATNAFIEFVDTTGPLELAVFHICEPMGANASFSFPTYLVRAKGTTNFVVGPADNGRKLSKQNKQLLHDILGNYPTLQNQVLTEDISFENFPAYIQRANQQGH